jgi:aldehyde:ferredoxin oxidoreductase
VAKGKLVKTKKRCCKSGPRCKKCPVVCKRLVKQGLATKLDDGRFLLEVTLSKKTLKAARAR